MVFKGCLDSIIGKKKQGTRTILYGFRILKSKLVKKSFFSPHNKGINSIQILRSENLKDIFGRKK